LIYSFLFDFFKGSIKIKFRSGAIPSELSTPLLSISFNYDSYSLIAPVHRLNTSRHRSSSRISADLSWQKTPPSLRQQTPALQQSINQVFLS